MADHAALYGLIGAVGGAMLGAGGAVVGPLLLHRRESGERREAERRETDERRETQRREAEERRETLRLQEEMAQQQRQFELRVAELERRAESERERTADLRARQEAVTARMARMRAATREWHLVLADAYSTLSRGKPVDPAAFEASWRKARSAVNEAFDEALRDGLWFSHARAFRILAPNSPAIMALTPTDQGIDVTEIGNSLAGATDAVERCVAAGVPLPGELDEPARRELRRLDIARSALTAHIIGRLGALGVSVRLRSDE
ncbi:hypothetical protein [Streptomyces sp. NPDC020917]|uniref:hypothetical protein n=1 Tax=Streptomyces sp. NPDC020917 TaxID=3365102 RepID=UPI0037A72439